jgi:hypothetical protein
MLPDNSFLFFVFINMNRIKSRRIGKKKEKNDTGTNVFAILQI